jgi:hypothetical protein
MRIRIASATDAPEDEVVASSILLPDEGCGGDPVVKLAKYATTGLFRPICGWLSVSAQRWPEQKRPAMTAAKPPPTECLPIQSIDEPL